MFRQSKLGFAVGFYKPNALTEGKRATPGDRHPALGSRDQMP
jgi:hypothetical protein